MRIIRTKKGSKRWRTWLVTGDYHGLRIDASNETEAREIFKKEYPCEKIICVKRLILPWFLKAK